MSCSVRAMTPNIRTYLHTIGNRLDPSFLGHAFEHYSILDRSWTPLPLVSRRAPNARHLFNPCFFTAFDLLTDLSTSIQHPA